MPLHAILCRRLGVLIALAAFVAVIPSLATPVARGDSTSTSFAGKFRNDKFTLELSQSPEGYVGTITQGSNTFPAKAMIAGQELSGTFVAGGNEFKFSATIANGRMAFVTNGETQSLSRVVSNPLNRNDVAAPIVRADQQPADPAPADPKIFEDTPTFGGFTVLGSTPRGKTLFIKLADAKTLESAMTQCADELGKVLDAKPELSGAFANANGKNNGGVTLTGKLKGHEIHGVIFCGVDVAGATATVIIATADASKEDMATLSASMPAQLKMQTHAFPDGSGSIDLPEGWTTPNTTALHGILVTGPAGQIVVFGLNRVINYPESRPVRTGRQIYQTQMNIYQIQMQNYQRGLEARRRFPNIIATPEPQKPLPPDPDPNIAYPAYTFCKYCDGPEEALKFLSPIDNARAKRLYNRYSDVDKIIEVLPLPANPLMPKSKTGAVYFAATDHDGDKTTHVRVVAQLQTSPTMDGEIWQLSLSQMRVPDATFDRDLPVMHAIMNSVKLDMNVIGKETQAETDAALAFGKQLNDALLKRGREFQEAQAIRFNNFERQMAAQAKARHDCNSDFIEYIGGVRTVYNTQTGQTFTVNLFNSNAIVNGLNAGANNPNQYVQIPLRYQR